MPNDSNVKAVILCNRRSGSTFLQFCLDSHPDITSLGEFFGYRYDKSLVLRNLPWFRGSKIKSPVRFIEEVIFPLGGNVIFKLMYDQCFQCNLLEYITEHEIPVIHLIRKNHVKAVLSALVAAQVRPHKIMVNPKEFVGDVKNREGLMANHIDCLKELPRYLEIYYEDMFGETKGKKTKTWLEGRNPVRRKRYPIHRYADVKVFLNPDLNNSLCDFFETHQFRMYTNMIKKAKDDIWFYLDRSKVEKLLIAEGFASCLS